MVSLKTGGGMKCRLLWAGFTEVPGCMPCLSTAVGGALIEEVELPVQTNGSGSQPWPTNRGTAATLLQVVLHQVLDDRATKIKCGKWFHSYLKACFLVEYVTVYCGTLEEVKEHFPPPLEGLPQERIVRTVLIVAVDPIHGVVVHVNSYWLSHDPSLAALHLRHSRRTRGADHDHG